MNIKQPLTGIGNYTRYLITGLLNGDYLDEIYCFNGKDWIEAESLLSIVEHSLSKANKDDHKISHMFTKHISNICLSYWGRDLKLIKGLKKKAPNEHGAIFHEPGFILRNIDRPSVVTIHDLSFLTHSEFHPKCRVKWLQSKLPKTLERANKIITISNVVRDQLINTYNLDYGFVKKIPLGVDESFWPRSRELSFPVLNKHGLRYKQYILFVGTIEPRKGIDVLLDTWLLMPEYITSSYTLVLAGAKGWCNKNLMTRINSLSSSGKIKYIKYVSYQDLPFIYSSAKIFVFPSLYEGFGLPVLEAMACGVPVICKNHTSMAEFSHEAAVLYDENDKEELMHEIISLLNDDALQDRCKKKGLTIATHYTWDRCAKKTYETYKEIMA